MKNKSFVGYINNRDYFVWGEKNVIDNRICLHPPVVYKRKVEPNMKKIVIKIEVIDGY